MDLLKRREGYKLEEVDGELLLYYPHSTKIIYCNETAFLIWQLCDGTRKEDEIVNALKEAYPEATDSIAEDVKEAIKQFMDHEALELV